MSRKASKTTSDSIEKTRRYHERYLVAINNPLRRELLKAIQEGCITIEALKSKTGLEDDVLKWHLNVLENGFCVEKGLEQGKLVYKITQEGRVIDYLK